MDKKNEKNLKLQANQLSNDDLESVAGGGEKVERVRVNGIHYEYWVTDEAGKFIRRTTEEEFLKYTSRPVSCDDWIGSIQR